jgi:hypothetical protein
MVTFTTNESRRLLQEMRRILNREATMMDQAWKIGRGKTNKK